MKLRSPLTLSILLASACTDPSPSTTDGTDGGGTTSVTDSASSMTTHSHGTETTADGDGTAGTSSTGEPTGEDTTSGEGPSDDSSTDEGSSDDSSTGAVPCSDASECDNGLYCDGVETCVEGVCVAGEPPCDDGVGCTDDACDENDRTCTHTPNDAHCDNGVHCDGAETCDANDGCLPGEAIECVQDDIACTTAMCDEQTQGCITVPDDASCDNGLFCDGAETCDVLQGCLPGEAPECDDQIACTIDSCSNALASCVFQPDDGLCGCGETCDPNQGCGNFCVPATCQGQTYACGDCIDNDGDCLIDMNDPDCWGPCDNNEAGWKGEIPGQQNQSPCNAMDCYFDKDGGAGNDGCYWSHTCDPILPNPSSCNYNPNYKVPGSSGQNCGQLFEEQSEKCLDYCGPLTPNGCDCFGCCDVFVEGDVHTVYLGSETNNNGTCSLEHADNEQLCHPCTKVDGCLNTCEECELCLGKTELPEHCDEEDQCPGGEKACGLEGQDPCAQGFFCLTGCCIPIPQ